MEYSLQMNTATSYFSITRDLETHWFADCGGHYQFPTQKPDPAVIFPFCYKLEMSDSLTTLLAMRVKPVTQFQLNGNLLGPARIDFLTC